MKVRLRKVIAVLMFSIVMMASLAGTVSAVEEPSALELKLREIVSDCIDSVDEDDEYAVAVWLHDWLIYHANYDFSYSEYEMDGVILKGTGVCQSYSYAYSELLNRMGIENKYIVSYGMNHMWNLIKVDGEWCHVDVTWDDPGEGGGYEHHGYFGLTDELIGRDHEWEPGDYPECTSLDNFYPKREGNIIVSDHSELIDAFEDICSDRKKTVDIYSISLDEDFVMYNIFKEWFDENNPTYKISSYSITYSGSTMTLNLTYFDSPSKGDVNGDSDVDMKDVTLVLKYLAEWEVEIDDTQSDVNGDGHIDMKDITLLLKYLAEWNVSI